MNNSRERNGYIYREENTKNREQQRTQAEA
jgi:hypothetical protein